MIRFALILILGAIILFLLFEPKIRRYFGRIRFKSHQAKDDPLPDSSSLKFSFELTKVFSTEITSFNTCKISLEKRHLIIHNQFRNLTTRKEFDNTPQITRVEKRVSENDEQLILNYISTIGFDKNLQEINAKKGLGTSVTFNFILSGPTASTVQVEGQLEIAGEESYVESMWGRKFLKTRTNIIHAEIVTRADEFIKFIKELIREEIPGAK